jgi:Hexokinase
LKEVRHVVLICMQQLTVEVTALVNDAVGTLASAQYGDAQHNTDTCISIIVGTGGRCDASISMAASFAPTQDCWRMCHVHDTLLERLLCGLHPGTNCCYLEQLSNIPKYQHQFLPRTSDMVINTVSSAISPFVKRGSGCETWYHWPCALHCYITWSYWQHLLHCTPSSHQAASSA